MTGAQMNGGRMNGAQMNGGQMNGGQWRRDADVVVIGSGAAGISVALTAAHAGGGCLW